MTEHLNDGGGFGDFEWLMAQVTSNPTDPAELDALYAGEQDVQASAGLKPDAFWGKTIRSILIEPTEDDQSMLDLVRRLGEQLGNEGFGLLCDALDPPSNNPDQQGLFDL